MNKHSSLIIGFVFATIIGVFFGFMNITSLTTITVSKKAIASIQKDTAKTDSAIDSTRFDTVMTRTFTIPEVSVKRSSHKVSVNQVASSVSVERYNLVIKDPENLLGLNGPKVTKVTKVDTCRVVFVDPENLLKLRPDVAEVASEESLQTNDDSWMAEVKAAAEYIRTGSVLGYSEVVPK